MNSKPVTRKVASKIFFAGLFSAFALVSCGGGSTSPVSSSPPPPAPSPAPATATKDTTPTLTLQAEPSTISPGTSSSIVWYSTNISSCDLKSGASIIAANTNANGSFNTPTLSATTPYTVTCYPTDTSKPPLEKAATVTVTGNPCATTGATGAIALSIAQSRLTGIAPLAVFFDASGTTTNPATPRPFHDLDYSWNFGEPTHTSPPVGGSLYWNNGSRAGSSRRNLAAGPVAAHVYETPGTYTVTLAVKKDDTNAVTNSCVNVEVLDPDAVADFAGTNTACFSTSGTFTGCPAGALNITTSAFDTAINTYHTAHKRLLFNRGETFTAATMAMVTSTGPGLIGAYGTGAQPVIQGTGNTQILRMSLATTPAFSDWRVMDLNLDGLNGNSSMGINGYGGMIQGTILRVTFTHLQNSLSFAGDIVNYFNNQYSVTHPEYTTGTIDQLAVVDSVTIPGTTTLYSGYNAGNRVAFMGNSFDNGGNTTGSHVLRFTFLNKAIISHNTIASPGNDRLAIKLHSPFWNATPSDTRYNPSAAVPPFTSNNYSPAMNGDGYSKYILIADNKVIDSGANPYAIDVGPENGGRDERVHDVILERNWFVAKANSQVSMYLYGSGLTVRNNIADFSTGYTGTQAMVFAESYTPACAGPVDQVRIYNNTFYSSKAASLVKVFQTAGAEGNTTNVSIYNNLAYAPNATGTPVVIQNNCGACLVASSNNTSNAQIKTSPPFTATPPVLITDWKPTAGYAIGAGMTAPVWYDLLGVPEPAIRDLGALAH